MYVLHYAPDNASLIVRLVLEELGVPYQTALVDRSIRAQDSAAYRALHPGGVIPALETPQGVVFETGAIVLHLADTHGRLALPQGDAARGAFLGWLFFLSNTLHADLRQVFYPEQYAGPDPALQRMLHGHVTARLHRHFALIDGLAGQGFVAFNHPDPSLLDFYAAVLLRWAQLYARRGAGWFDPATSPGLVAMAARLERRASVRAAAQAEGLGPHPFTKPQLPQPPEGSAT